MPEPQAGEARDDWIDRCMSDPEATADFPDAGQRFAVCVSKWEGRKSMMHYKNATLELKREPDDDGVIEGYASVFDVVDNGMDVVRRGAFRKTLGTRKVKMLWQHDMAQPVGVWDEITEDERGLYVRGRILKEVQRGREAMALYKAGAMDSLSIGYRVVQASPEGSGRVRALDEVDLFEISLVTIPMNEAATASVKGIRTIRDFEKAMRDAGFSRNEAKAIAADGFRGLADHRDDVEAEVVVPGLSDLAKQIRQLQEKFHV